MKLPLAELRKEKKKNRLSKKKWRQASKDPMEEEIPKENSVRNII